jgi:glycosyltransferase involved in cell wall biosynthesis
MSTTERATGPGGEREALRVLHVVQKYSSGVGSAIAQYTHSLPDLEHHLLSGTAVDAEGDLAQQAGFAGTHRMVGSPLARIRRIREVVAELRPDVVHAHSSHGGAFTRLAVRAGRNRIVYTPHCYAFERRDVRWPARAAFRMAEAALAFNTSVFAACSPREAALSERLSSAPVVLVPNVVGGGRISPQKDPEFFAGAVRALRREEPALRAVWLGDGEPAMRAALEQAGVEVTGWLPSSGVLAELGAADLYLHSALWEGFPLMVAEAVALGVPTLVRPVPSFSTVPAALRMGSPDDVDGALACLRNGAAARTNTDSWETLLAENTVDVQASRLAEAYGVPVRVPDRG